MSNLKRLLNPEPNDQPYPHHRPLEGWDADGAPVDVTAVLSDTSWNDYPVDLLGPEYFQTTIDQSLAEFSIDHASLFVSQEEAEQWPTESMTPQLTSSSSSPGREADQEQICYGMIYRASVRLRGDMSGVHTKLSSGGGHPVPGFYKMGIKKSDQQFLVTFPDESELGEVNAQMEKALTGLAEQQQSVSLEVFAPIRPIQETIGRASKKGDAIVRVNVNVYGTRTAARNVGKEFSSYKVYLQRPDYVRPDTIYDNPHVLKLAKFQPSAVESGPETQDEKLPDSDVQKAEAFKKTISTIYSSLTRNQSLVGVEGDDRLKTELLPHQKRALEFMAQRESGPIPERYRLWQPSEVEGQPCFRHAITNKSSHLEYPEIGGGILADEMGMGKTLSILALMLRTVDAAHCWASDQEHAVPGAHRELSHRRRSRATLIVASSDLMINEWVQEMDRHFQNRVFDALTMIKYHGTNRQNNMTKLCDADLVITTYHTLASDFTSNKNLLNDIAWYRLVLDEAHIVRRQSTVLYRTVAELKARSRWCLTGTPIQNRLEDIGSLFAFIRIIPFNSASNFRKYIATPFDDGGKRRDVAIERFTRLLDSLCLRRTKDLLHLPDQEDRVRNLEFSQEERIQYDQTQNMMMRAAKNQVGGFDQKSTLGLFQVQLQLRILCNHGTYQQPFSWNRRKLHLIDEREAMEASMGRDGEVTCSACKQTMSVLDAGTMYRRFTEHCRHVLCLDCIEESMPIVVDNAIPECPLCAHLHRAPKQANPADVVDASEEDHYFRPQGTSSKMEALMTDVQANVYASKSIIFSCWTHTLDLIGAYLRRASIVFERIDGECPTAKRQKILADFANNPQLRVLIMTTGTGAVGLNLATANRVFIVEPQWNPSVENQAIARALRLGQEQKVQVTRYVVNRTVEQEMRSLQDRKLKMAGMAWE